MNLVTQLADKTLHSLNGIQSQGYHKGPQIGGEQGNGKEERQDSKKDEENHIRGSLSFNDLTRDSLGCHYPKIKILVTMRRFNRVDEPEEALGTTHGHTHVKCDLGLGNGKLGAESDEPQEQSRRNVKNYKNSNEKSLIVVTCHHILRGCITIGAHYTGRYMCLISFWTIFGKSKVRKLSIVVLE